MPYYMMPRGDYYMGDYYQGDPSIFGKAFAGIKSFFGLGGPSQTTVMVQPPPRGILQQIGAFAKQHPIISTAAGYLLGGAAGAGIARLTSGLAPHEVALRRGYHVSRKTGKLVRNRRLNPANVRALRRALRRARGFEHLARRVLRITRPGTKVKGFKLHHRRRKAA